MANYRIVNQLQTVDFTPGGQFLDVMEVTFEIPSGAQGTVKIPLRDFQPEAVAQVVNERAATMQRIEELTGE